ncbi:zinc-dependent peptidase [Aquisphaera insulae]|uniref:zinc-dependent peptidase n=1 Tax=Aquisphaera insulae TaxID=2712864 RepID=UPI0013EDED70|nr:zinc-dependent peptidase [Aquisphaera insulae]
MTPVILAPLLATAMMVGDFEPTASYRIRNVGGFTVLVSRKLGEHPEEAAAGIKELEKQVAEINRVVPARALPELHRVRIWVDWDVDPDGGCVFHPSRKWLEEHAVNPDKAGCVEVSNLRHFIDWSRAVQPCMILHEMAHAYDFRVLDARDPRVSAAFRHAMEKKLYDSVEYGPGGKKRAYAATNEREYFAELTEAYFSRNDFYPFRHDELKAHDPEGYSALEAVWGKPEIAREATGRP